MTAAAVEQERPGTAGQRWLARLAVLVAAAAVVIVPVFAELKSLAMLVVGLVAVAISIASAYLFLARRGCCAGWRWRSSSSPRSR